MHQRKQGLTLATRPGSFQFVFRHELKALRLNLIDELFRQDSSDRFLCGISVKSKEKLRLMRIYKRFEEINEMPAVLHWRCRMEEIDPSEEVKIGLAI